MVAHVITDLRIGGAEIILDRVLERSDPSVYEHIVVALRDPEPLAASLRARGIAVHCISEGRWSGRDMLRLLRLMRRLKPDVVQTWMIHANVLGGVASKMATGAPIAWGIHFGRIAAAEHGRVLLALQILESGLSRLVPDTIIACSETSAEEMRSKRYARKRIRVIPNGFDLEYHAPGIEGGLRRRLGIPNAAFVAGHVSRWHPQKDQATLIAALRMTMSATNSVHVLLCGDGLSYEQPAIAELAEEFPGRVHAIGRTNDARSIYATIDLLVCSSSRGEAFPLVIGEAMACGVPVLSTDCGDAKMMVGHTGKIVPTENPGAMHAAIGAFADLPPESRVRLGEEARARIADRYELGSVTNAYETCWLELAGGGR